MLAFSTLLFFILSSGISFTKNVDASFNESNLIKVIVLFRHGMRAPLNSYAFDPSIQKDSLLWPEGFGSLLTEGKRQMFEFGKQLRTRYSNLLIPHGKSIAEDLKMVTTAVDRCYMSAALMLAGFYPAEDENWNNELLWQPVPISSPSPDKLHIVVDKKKCPVYTSELEDVKYKTRDDENIKYLFNYVSNFTYPKKINDSSSLFMVADYFVTKRSLGLALPIWADENFLTRLDKYYVESFHYLTSTQKMRKLLTGPLIQDIMRRIRDTIYNTPENSKFYFYSGHDSSLHSLLKTMEFNITFVPSYGASIILELYRSTSNNHLIRILYSKDYSLQHLEIKKLPKCEEFCAFGQFVQIFDEFIIQDWQKECEEYT